MSRGVIEGSTQQLRAARDVDQKQIDIARSAKRQGLWCRVCRRENVPILSTTPRGLACDTCSGQSLVRVVEE